MDTKKFTEIIWDAYPMEDLTLNSLGLCAEAGEYDYLIVISRYQEVSF